jgi:hypothetical protein
MGKEKQVTFQGAFMHLINYNMGHTNQIQVW